MNIQNKLRSIAFFISTLIISTNSLSGVIYSVESGAGIVGDKIAVDNESNNDVRQYILSKYQKYGHSLQNIKISFDGNSIKIDERPRIVSGVSIKLNDIINNDLIHMLDLEDSILSSKMSFIGQDLIGGLNNIKNHFNNLGYPNAKIKFNIIDNFLFIDASTGDQVRVINFSINSDIKNVELFDLISKKFAESPLYSKDLIDKSILTIKRYLDNNGFFNGEIIVNKDVINNNALSLNFKIFGNEKTPISKIQIDNWYLDTPYGFKHVFVGDLYSVENLKLEISLLMKSGLFSKVTPLVAYDEQSNSVRITINVDRKKTGMISAGAMAKGFENNLFFTVSEKNFLNNGILFSSTVTKNETSLGFISSITLDRGLSFGYSLVTDTSGLVDTKEHSVFLAKEWGEIDKTKISARVFKTLCVGCDLDGIETSISHTINRADDNYDPRNGYTLKASLSSVWNGSLRNYVDIEHSAYKDMSEAISVDNNFLMGVSFKDNYDDGSTNKLNLRGMLHDSPLDGKVIFGNKSNAFVRSNILGMNLKSGIYLDALGSTSDYKNSKYINGFNIRTKLDFGVIEVYRSIGSNFDNWSPKFGVLVTSKF